MLKPTKHQDLDSNLLVVGANILYYLKDGELEIEFLYRKLLLLNNIRIEQYLDTITFLWLIDSIVYENNKIKKKKDDFTENIF